MGWASASDIFDPVASAIADAVDAKAIGEDRGKFILVTLIQKLQEGDWDTEDESLDAFQDRPVVVEAFAECGIAFEPEELTAVEGYALRIVADYAESGIEDDIDEDGDLSEDEFKRAVGLAHAIVRGIRANPAEVLALAEVDA